MGEDKLEEDQQAGAAQGSSLTSGSGDNEEDGTTKVDRGDRAKAFYRAMYAGGEVPDNAEFGSSGAQQASSVEDGRRINELTMQVRDYEQRALEAEKLYKRMAADFDNFRRRVDREKEELQYHGVNRTLNAIIPALDDLDRAMTYLNVDTPPEKLIESFNLVAGRIFQCLEQVGVKPLVTAGEMFDPKFHEPVQQVETTELPDGAIAQELRKGYLVGEKVLRPALVNVASNPHGSVSAPGAGTEASPESDSELSVDEVFNAVGAGKSGDKSASVDAETTDKVYDLGSLEDLD